LRACVRGCRSVGGGDPRLGALSARRAGDLNDEWNAFAFLRKEAETAIGLPSSSSSSSAAAAKSGAAAGGGGASVSAKQQDASRDAKRSEAEKIKVHGSSSLSEDAAKACAADEKGKMVDARFRSLQAQQNEGGQLSLVPVVAALKSILIKL
jgi:hypothetical protein